LDYPTPGNLGGPIDCGRINAVDLISLPEREAVEYARRGGCEVRVVTRDGRAVGPTAYYQDPDLPVTVVHVSVRDGYVYWLGR
jgi:hypothetical protein